MNNKINNSKKTRIALACVLVFILTSCKGSGKMIGNIFGTIFATIITIGTEEVANCHIESRKKDCLTAKANEKKDDKTKNTPNSLVHIDNNSKLAPKMNSFYFLADTAFSKIENANNEIKKLKNLGYNQTGKFWLEDYPNLSNKPYYQVYIAKFNSRINCIEYLKSYIQRNQDAYCALASTNKNVSPDYFGSYSLKNRNI